MASTKYGIPISQIQEINDLLIEYSMGNYGYQGKVSDNLDEIDTIIVGVNMLGQELQATTVSRDYFLSIFNAATNLVFVIQGNGNIESANDQSLKYLKRPLTTVSSSNINNFIKLPSYPKRMDKFSEYVIKNLKTRQDFGFEAQLFVKKNEVVPMYCSCSRIINSHNKLNGYLIVAEDISERKNMERLVLRAAIEAQQKEQDRVAQDLHDAIGQDLSALSMMISNLKTFIGKNDMQAKRIFETSEEILKDTIKHLRSICFNLMPSALQKGDLKDAVSQLIDKLKEQNKIKFIGEFKGMFDNVDKGLSLTIYRIIQEFINNTLKHAEATLVEIKLEVINETMNILLLDNGKGFNLEKIRRNGKGLQNFQSRVRAFNGEIDMQSELGKGVKIEISFPLNVEEID